MALIMKLTFLLIFSGCMEDVLHYRLACVILIRWDRTAAKITHMLVLYCKKVKTNILITLRYVSIYRSLVLEMTQKEDKVLVLSYSRKVLGQTGDGHFSPVGGYHPERDLVLILDTARFKYPPHWVSLRLIWDAMLALDKSTGESVRKKSVLSFEKNLSYPLMHIYWLYCT